MQFQGRSAIVFWVKSRHYTFGVKRRLTLKQKEKVIQLQADKTN